VRQRERERESEEPEGGRSDEDLSVEYDDSTCLNWKEILSLTNDYDKVNPFLIEKML
jgi:hypothetical protein